MLAAAGVRPFCSRVTARVRPFRSRAAACVCPLRSRAAARVRPFYSRAAVRAIVIAFPCAYPADSSVAVCAAARLTVDNSFAAVA